MSIPSKDKIYGGCKVLHPDGTLMFRCTQARVDWYLDRNLATIVSQEDEPITIQFTFTPKGYGNNGDPFYLQEKSNQCVCCGNEELLTRHHVVPYCYRKNFPAQFKKSCSHDVLLLCIDCHEKYEIEARALKIELAEQYGVVSHAKDASLEFKNARNTAFTLINHKDKIPEERQQFLRDSISKYLGREVTEEDILSLVKLTKKAKKKMQHQVSHAVKLVEQIDNLMEFIKMWRKHFVKVMQPKFLDEYWDVDRTYKNEQVEARTA
jgi:hypothetical protein